MTDSADALIAAWKRWDEHPTSEQMANRLVDATINLAKELGTTSLEVSRAMCAEAQPGENRTMTMRRVLERLDASQSNS